MKFPLTDSALAQHVAIIGKTGSGKTTTAKGAIEHIVRRDPRARVCIIDPIKSDWWGITSSADGRSAGLPFHILGGPHGHVPLHVSTGAAIGELVATGALPLSIIDMADFKAGGLQQFFNDFAPALMRKMSGVVHLVLEEAHEFAPKERAGIGAETMAIYHAKKLATAGRSKGIRLMVVSQATQQLHNRVLGSCDTLVAHRFTAPADQRPILDWLKANAPKEALAEVGANLAKLRTGTAYVVSGDTHGAELATFPPLTTFDNSATPTGSTGGRKVTTAPVDLEKLKAIMGDAVVEAEANDPAKLKARVRELELAAAAKPVADASALEHARLGGLREGFTAGAKAQRAADAVVYAQRLEKIRIAVSEAFAEVMPPAQEPTFPRVDIPHTARAGSPTPAAPIPQRSAPLPSRSPSGPPAEGLKGPEQRILDALAWWRAVGLVSPARVQVATVAGYSVNSTSFTNPLGALNKKALLYYPTPGAVELTAEGAGLARSPGAAPTTAELHARIFAILKGPQRRILEPLLRVYPGHLSREESAKAADYSATSTSYTNPLGALKSLGLIDYPAPGQVRALPILFVE